MTIAARPGAGQRTRLGLFAEPAGNLQALRILRELRVVSEQKHGRERLYRLEPAELKDVADWILPYRDFWQASLGNLKSYLENE